MQDKLFGRLAHHTNISGKTARKYNGSSWSEDRNTARAALGFGGNTIICFIIWLEQIQQHLIAVGGTKRF